MIPLNQLADSASETTKHTPLKVYCDASFNHETDMGYGGCIMCNHTGKPLGVASDALGYVGDSVTSEIEILTRVLDTMENISGVDHIIVYSDCHPAVKKANRMDELDRGFESVSVEWIPREENRVADMLAVSKMESYLGDVAPPNAQKYGTTD